MNTQYLDTAKERINNVPLLVNLVSRRVRQLNRGQRPLVKSDNPQMSKMDIALKEVSEGILTAEMGFTAADDMPVSDEKVITL
jgi:DNA-directed RNA polymerase subunit omega